MNKRIYSSALLCTLIAFLVSCSGDNSPAAETATMQIKSCSVFSNNILSANFASPIGLYILKEDNQPYVPNSHKNSAYLSGEKWVVNTPVYITGKGKVYAYFPYSSSGSFPKILVDMSKQVDILFTKTPSIIDAGNFSLALTLSHALSQIVVSVENEEVESLSFLSPASGAFNISSGIFSDLTVGEVKTSSGKLLVIPHSCTGSEIKFKLKSGNEYTYAISNIDFMRGESYAYEFKLNADREQLEILSVTVEEWVNDSIFQDYI